MYKFHDTTTRMRTHTHDHRLQSDINTILIITNQVEITITIITISSVDTQQWYFHICFSWTYSHSVKYRRYYCYSSTILLLSS